MNSRIYIGLAVALAVSSIGLQPAFSQGKGGTGSTGTTGGAGGAGAGGAGAGGAAGTGGATTGSRPTSPTTIPNPNQTQQQTPQSMPQPIFVSGRVLLEDGTPPTDSVVIERVCNGQPHSEGYTDTKGY